MEIGRFAFLRATYDDRIGLIGKRVVDFLLALTLIELFFAICFFSMRSYERLFVENRRFRSNGRRLTQNVT